MAALEHEAPTPMVADERRVSDRRACLHVATDEDRCVELLNRDERAYQQLMLVEAQAAADVALEQLAHLIASLQQACSDARQSRAASVAARRAAYLAAGAVSGATS